MPIDPSIALQVRPVQIQDPVNQLAKLLQAQNMQQDNALGRLKMDEYQRSVTDSNALNDLYRGAVKADGTIDRNALYSGAAQRGLGAKIPALQKQFLDADEAKGKVDKQKVELIDAKLKQSRAYLDTVQTPEQYLQWHEANHADPILGPELAARGVTAEQARASIVQALQQPGGFEQLKQRSALGIEKFTELNKPTTHYANTGGTTQIVQTPGLGGAPQVVGSMNNTQSPDNAASVAATMRGQNMADSRARESQAIQRDAANAGKVPAGYRVGADGRSLEFIPGGPADPNAAKRAAPTEFQGKAAMFGTRAQEADRIISELEGKYSPAGINTKQALGRTPLVGGALEAGSNLVLSDESQKAEQAQRDFVNAVLRLESGAAIGQSEFDNARRQYFRQPGDSPAVVAQKAQNRRTAIQGLINNARPGDIDALLKKYGGK
jgi:hypothetical protein